MQVSGSGTSGCDGVRVSRPALSSVSSQDTYPGPSGQRLLRPQEDRDWTAWDRVAPMWRASGCLSGLNVLSTKKYRQDRTVTGTRRDERTVNPVCPRGPCGIRPRLSGHGVGHQAGEGGRAAVAGMSIACPANAITNAPRTDGFGAQYAALISVYSRSKLHGVPECRWNREHHHCF